MSEKQNPPYDFQAVETKWQQRWSATKAFAAPDKPAKRKYYVLEMFPYPSGNLHMGHVRNYAIGDLIARFKRLEGYEVMHPMGWDSFGLPAENAAIKDGKDPAVRTEENIVAVRKQFDRLGISYDWDRELATHRPEYYKWNQWFFLKMYEKGIVYRRESEVNWCPSCLTVLAHAQVEDGKCWRCESVVEKKKMPEWAFKITAYAQALLDGVDELDAGLWPSRVTAMQRNWIGKSVGLECDFAVDGSAEKIRVFTTRADTIHGATYAVVAPEHPVVAKITTSAQKAAVEAFADRMKKTDKDKRTADDAPKEGVFTGAHAINPFTKQKIPVWVANFVLADYGTGAVMSVPAHDHRDFAFAKKYELPIAAVICAPNSMPPHVDTMTEAFTEDGLLVSSEGFTGLTSAVAREKITEMAERGGFGAKAVKWHLRDWGISRQRYWGTPIPVIYCEKDGMLMLREQDLPVVLPKDVKLTGDGGAPLAKVPAFVNTTCWKCGGPARREAETMDTFVDSTWYFARFLDPKNATTPFRREVADAWLPVDLYIGGPEHAVLHLLYFRFWTMVMKELGLVSHGEPAARLLTQGIVYKDGNKMSKSKGNVVSPDDMVAKYGADTARVFSLFAAPPEKDLEWDDKSVEGSYRFLRDTWNLVHDVLPMVQGAKALDPAELDALPASKAAWRKVHATVKRVTEAIGTDFHYNVGVSSMMELKNTLKEIPAAEKETVAGRSALRFGIEKLLQCLNPYAPHIAAELWEAIGSKDSLDAAGWPSFDAAALISETTEVVVQVMGKTRGAVVVPTGSDQAAVEAVVRADAGLKKWFDGKTVARVIFPKGGKLINFVVKD